MYDAPKDKMDPEAYRMSWVAAHHRCAQILRGALERWDDGSWATQDGCLPKASRAAFTKSVLEHDKRR